MARPRASLTTADSSGGSTSRCVWCVLISPNDTGLAFSSGNIHSSHAVSDPSARARSRVRAIPVALSSMAHDTVMWGRLF